MLMIVALVLMAIALLTLRRGTLGRVLIAMRDSPSACSTLGLDMRWFRVGLFAMSAGMAGIAGALFAGLRGTIGARSEEHTSELQSLMRISYAVFCLKKKKKNKHNI